MRFYKGGTKSKAIYRTQQKLLALENDLYLKKLIEKKDNDGITFFLKNWLKKTIDASRKEVVLERLYDLTGNETVSRLLYTKTLVNSKFKGSTFTKRLNSMLSGIDKDLRELKQNNNFTFDSIRKLLFSSDIRRGFSSFYKHSALFLVSEPNILFNKAIKSIGNLYSGSGLYWVTMSDDKVCDVCKMLEVRSPYKFSTYPEYPHPLCRCHVKIKDLVPEYNKDGIDYLMDLYAVKDGIDSGVISSYDDVVVNIFRDRFSPKNKYDRYIDTEINLTYRYIIGKLGIKQ